MLLSIMKLLVTKLNSWLKSTLLCVSRVKSIQTFQKLIMCFPFCVLYFKIIMIFIIILYLKNDSVSRWIIWVSLFYISFRVIFVIILTFKCIYSTQLYCIFQLFFCISIINIIITIILFIFSMKYLWNISQMSLRWELFECIKSIFNYMK